MEVCSNLLVGLAGDVMLQTRVNKGDNSNNHHDAADDDTNRTSTSKNLQLKKNEVL